jgi:hypothetical protein
MAYLPFHAKAESLADCFNHLTPGQLEDGAAFCERTAKGWPADPMRCFLIGKCGFLVGRTPDEYGGLPHPSQFIAGWHQEASDRTMVVSYMKGLIR